jgi:hypothetical protein
MNQRHDVGGAVRSETRDHGCHLGQPVRGFHDGQPAGADP